MHIFEHQWVLKNDIVKDIIRKRLDIVDNKIYARKCSIKEIENKELSWPDKVTLGWFIKHMPAGIWWGLICTLLAVLTAAYELGAYIQSHSISLP